MKRQFIFCCFSLVVAASICSSQESPALPRAGPTPFKTIRSATTEAIIIKLEKSVTDAFKNKQAKSFREYLDPEFSAVDAEGVKDADAEVADMQKTDLTNYSFADMKMTLLNPKMAVATPITSPLYGINEGESGWLFCILLSKLSKTWAISKGRTEFENELAEIKKLIDRKKIEVVVPKTFLLSEAVRAQVEVATLNTRGKIVLEVADEPK